MKEKQEQTIDVGGNRLFYIHWAPEDEPQATVLIAHGYAEHSGRYEHVAHALNEKGYSVFALDFRGHGKSEGLRGFVRSFTEYIDDLHALRGAASSDGSPEKTFLIGHSNGGLVALSYCIQHQTGLTGLILSSPYLRLKMQVPGWKATIGKVVSGVLPRLDMPSGIPPEDLSHDPEVVKAYADDPLVFDTANARWFTESQAAMEYVEQNAGRVAIPVLCMYGADDPIADHKQTENVAARIGSADKQIIPWSGMLHEIFNEVEHEKVLTALIDWLDKH